MADDILVAGFADSASLRNVELLVSVNFKHLFIGAILRARQTDTSPLQRLLWLSLEDILKRRFSLVTYASKLHTQKEF